MAKTKVTRVKPQQQKQKTPFFATLWFYVKSLFSNGVVFEIGANKKWYFSIIIFLISTFLTVLPTAVSQFKIKGSDFITGAYGDSFYYGLYDYATNDANADLIKFNDNFTLSSDTQQSGSYNATDCKTSYDATESWIKPIYTFSRDGKTTDLDIYAFTKVEYEEDAKFSSIIKNIKDCNTVYAESTDDAKKIALEKDKHTRLGAFIVFMPNKVYISSFNTQKQEKAIMGDYLNVLNGFKDLEGAKTFHSLLGYNASLKDAEKATTTKMSSVRTNFSTYLDKIYENAGRWAAWQTVLIVGAINVGAMLIAGLVLWLLTLGKNAANKGLNILQTMSMAFWLSLTPAILGMALGFIIPTFAYMAFVLFYAMRTMYMATKYIRPPMAR